MGKLTDEFGILLEYKTSTEPLKKLKKQKIITKEIVIKDCIITIDKLVKQTKDKLGCTNEQICFLVTIKDPLSKGQTMFRADSVKELWKMIEQESRVWL